MTLKDALRILNKKTIEVHGINGWLAEVNAILVEAHSEISKRDALFDIHLKTAQYNGSYWASFYGVERDDGLQIGAIELFKTTRKDFVLGMSSDQFEAYIKKSIKFAVLEYWHRSQGVTGKEYRRAKADGCLPEFISLEQFQEDRSHESDWEKPYVRS